MRAQRYEHNGGAKGGRGEPMNTARRVAKLGILSALAIALSALELFLPIHLLIPLPGIKIGIANIALLLTLHYVGTADAFAVLLVRCVVCAVLFGNPVSFAMSLSGGLLALTGSVVLLKLPRFFSWYGVSIAGAALHNTGQIICAAVWLHSLGIFSYLPVLLLFSIFSGSVIALICSMIFKKYAA